MSHAIEWTLETEIKDGKRDVLKALIQDMSESMHAGEPGTLHFEWYIDADEKKCTTVERYADSDAALEHLVIFKDLFVPRILDALAPFRLTVYGPATPKLRAALQGFHAVHYELLGGFHR